MGLNNVDTDTTVENQQQQNINSLPITPNPKVKKVLRENNSQKNFNNNLKKILDLNQKPNDSNLGAVKTTMAPALTEPLRSANQLTSSSPNAASASPRPHATSNNSSSKKNGNDCLIEFPMGPMSEPNTNITNTSSLGTNNLENIDENIPITLVHLQNDFEEAISAEICMKSGGVLENCKNTINQESFEHMDSSEPDNIIENVHLPEQSQPNDQENVLPSSPPPSLASQHNIGSEEKLAGFDFKELPRISQDSTITASEGNDAEGKTLP